MYINTNHPLNQFEEDLKYLELLLISQSETYRYNWLSIQLENNIDAILTWIKKNSGKSKMIKVKYAFDLLRKYLLLFEKYYENHPWRPLIENND